MRPLPLSARYGELGVASIMWECLFLQAKSGRCSQFLAGVVAEVWLWSDGKEAKTSRLQRGFSVAGKERWCRKANARDFLWGPRTLP